MINLFLNMQDPSSYVMEKLSFFHDYSMFFLILIFSIVIYNMAYMLMGMFINNKLLYNESVETLWTVLPGIILLFIALPSLKTLYMMEDISSPELTIKVVGSQWFWSYEYSDFLNVNFDSYMLKDLEKSDYRYLEVDNRVIIPQNTPIRVIVTSCDVIHSWACPSLGVKVDANPGRLNQVMISANKLGLFYGQCSEICGVLHSFMPICVEVSLMSDFLNYMMMN